MQVKKVVYVELEGFWNQCAEAGVIDKMVKQMVHFQKQKNVTDNVNIQEQNWQAHVASYFLVSC